MKVKLVPLEPLPDVKTVNLDCFPVVVGRDEEVELPLRDRWVSRRHCQLFEQDGKLMVRDLGSKHGTLVNHAPVQESPLEPGDVFSVGLTTFRAVYRSAQRSGASVSAAGC